MKRQSHPDFYCSTAVAYYLHVSITEPIVYALTTMQLLSSLNMVFRMVSVSVKMTDSVPSTQQLSADQMHTFQMSLVPIYFLHTEQEIVRHSVQQRQLHQPSSTPSLLMWLLLEVLQSMNSALRATFLMCFSHFAKPYNCGFTCHPIVALAQHTNLHLPFSRHTVPLP